MDKHLSIMLFIGLMVSGCHSFWKTIPVQKDGNNIEYAIQIAINDFSKLKRLHKKDSVFSVRFRSMPQNNSLLVVSIISKTTNLLMTKDVVIGSKDKIASRCIEKDGKLYYWWDDDYSLTQEALSIFGKYGLLQDDEGGMIASPDGVIDDKKKGASYYFCKDNPQKFKRVITNIADGYYTPPVLDCDSLKN